MRIQVSMSDSMVERLDKIADEMGVSRSALCTTFIGQAVLAHEKTYSFVQDALVQMGNQAIKSETKKPKK